MTMRLHVVGLPHTETTRGYLHCAYTQKLLKFADMMTAEGHEVILYAGEQNEAACAEHVPLITGEERRGWFGDWDSGSIGFGGIEWDPDLPYWRMMNARAAAAIHERAGDQDLLCLVAGWSQSPIAEALPQLLPVEWAVGYPGIFLPHRVFESYAWMHHVYGLKGIEDGHYYDAVIPNFFDPADFPLLNQGDGDYLLFLGRLIRRKGPHVAAAIAERAGLPLKVAGPGGSQQGGRIVGCDVEFDGPVEYVGPVGLEERAELLAGARALIVPTVYIEPFGGVAVEAMLAGTPVVASDWGAFTETVQPGVSGERFRTLAEGAAAVDTVGRLDPEQVRGYALDRYSLAAVGPQFTRHFARLQTLYGAGWYAEAEEPAAVG